MSAPNFLIFLTDDHAAWTLPAYGNREVLSPSLNHLAAPGVVFENAFCPSPVCSPARASFWTGRMPSAHGIHDWIPEGRDNGQYPAIDRMPGNLVSRLQGAGYVVAGCGKYHCGHPILNPLGADYWFVQVPPIEYANLARQTWWDNGRRATGQAYQTTVITEAALRFLRQRDRQRPFFLFVGHVNTHTPHRGEPCRLRRLYENAEFGDAPAEPFSAAHGRARFVFRSEEDRREKLRQYYASVTAIDEQVGRLMDELDSSGDLASTHVIYTSDHGHMNGQHGLHTKGNATVPVNFLEESIRVPLLWQGPEIPAGRRIDAMVDHCDLYATLLDLAGSQPVGRAEDGAALPGRSYRSALHDMAFPGKAVQFAEYGNARMARTPGGKLIRRYAGPNGRFPDEFYDLERDPRERINAIEEPASATAVRELDAALTDFFGRYSLPQHSGLDLANLSYIHDTSPWNIDPVAFPVLHQ